MGKVPGTKQAFNKWRLLSQLIMLHSNFLLTCPPPLWTVIPCGERHCIIYENKVASQKMLPTRGWVDRGMEGGRDRRIEEWRGEGEGEELPHQDFLSAQPPKGGLRSTCHSSAETIFSPLLSHPRGGEGVVWGEHPEPALNARTCCQGALTFPRAPGPGSGAGEERVSVREPLLCVGPL